MARPQVASNCGLICRSGADSGLPQQGSVIETVRRQLATHAREATALAMVDPLIKQRAIDWFVLLNTEECIDPHLSEFDAWFKEKAEHEATYRQIEKSWDQARAAVISGLSAQLRKRDRKAAASRRLRLRLLIRHVAPTALTVVLILVLLAMLTPPMRAMTEFETAYEKPKSVMLADRSIVTLNTNSRLRVMLGLTNRYLVLERGEALFQVHRESFRHFRVVANGVLVTATGTEFSVDLGRDGQVVTAVADGKVDIVHEVPAQAGAGTPTQEQTVTVAAGDTATIFPGTGVVVDHTGVTGIKRKMLWKEGLIALDRGSLQDWVGEFNRYNRRTLQIEDPAISKIQISGAFNASDPDNFVDALQESYAITHSSTGSENSKDGVIFLRAAK